MQKTEDLISICKSYQHAYAIDDTDDVALLQRISKGYLSLSPNEKFNFMSWLTKEIDAFDFPGSRYPHFGGAIIGGFVAPMITTYLTGSNAFVSNALSLGIGLFAGEYTAQRVLISQQLNHVCKSPLVTKNFIALTIIDSELELGCCPQKMLHQIHVAYEHLMRLESGNQVADTLQTELRSRLRATVSLV